MMLYYVVRTTLFFLNMNCSIWYLHLVATSFLNILGELLSLLLSISIFSGHVLCSPFLCLCYMCSLFSPQRYFSLLTFVVSYSYASWCLPRLLLLLCTVTCISLCEWEQKGIFYILSFVKVSATKIRVGVCFTLLPITTRSKHIVKAYRFIQRKHRLTNSQMSFNYGLLRKQLASVNHSHLFVFPFYSFQPRLLTTSRWIC